MRAIFLGSFNPPHKGHISVLESVISRMALQYNSTVTSFLEKIHIIPCWQNPNKENTVDFFTRYNMCKLEFAHLSEWCVVDEIESIVKPKYTYELIDYLHQGKDKFIGDDFWWIITEETLCELMEGKWKESERLLGENKFIICHPCESYWDVDFEITKFCSKNGIINWPVFPKNIIDAHSTQIRENIWKNKKYDDYISKETKEYILEHNLYK